jgi:cytochrome c
MKLLKRIFLVVVALALVGAAYYAWITRPIPDFGRKVLVFSKTTAYRHEVISTAVTAVTELGRREQFNVVATEDSELFSDENLKQYQAVLFLNTTGDVLDDEQQVAFERYIQAGGGYLGIHAAADTEWREDPWFWYQRLVGGVFISHPSDSDQLAELAVVGEHPALDKLPKNWTASDEWYDFQRVSKDINVLLTVDEGSYEGGQMGENHPIVWYRDFDGGRSFYIGLGHTASSYENTYFLSLLHGGLEYAMGGGIPLDYSKSRPEPWRYTRVVLDSNLDEPLKLTFSPDGELYYIQRRGALRHYDTEQQTSVTVAELDVYSEQEYGLIGLVFDPDFANNNWLYLFRTVAAGNSGRNVLSRFKFVDNVLDTASEEELLSIPVDGNASLRATHTGGDMQFDGEGNLWISTGDDTHPGDHSLIDDRPGQQFRDAARSAGNTMDLRGKLLRITPQEEGGYTIPEGNLFADSSQGRPEIYIMGLRNPYTIAYDDRTSTVYWGEVGPDGKAYVDRGPWGYDEINRSSSPGNFGWPYVIAANEPYTYYDYEKEKALDLVDIAAPENRSRNNTGAKVLPPAKPAWIYYPYEYSDIFPEFGAGGRNSLVAPLYYSDDYPATSEVRFPSFMDGKLIVSDFIRRWIQVVSTDASGNVETITPLIDTPLSAPLDMAFGPDGALYVVEYGSNWFTANEDSFISRIEFYSGDNPPPVAVASASKTVGASPLEAVLDGSESYDRGAGSLELTYRWQLLVNGEAARELGTQPLQPVTIDEEGEHYIQLTVTDVEGSSTSTRLRLVVGNERPEVRLNVSGNRSFYFNDAGLDYAVTVEDLEDGSLGVADTGPEIAPGQVSVIFDYIGQSEDLAKALSSRTSDAVLEGRALATRGSDCHACHGVEKNSVGPSFVAIAERYFADESGVEASRDYLEDVISTGGSGKWDGGHAMPAHPDLTDSELGQVVAFIQSLAGSQETTGGGLPLSGSVAFDRHLEDSVEAIIEQVVTVNLGLFYPGSYLLHASYTDSGTGSAGPLQGSDTLILRHARVSPEAFDEVEGVLTFAVGDAMSLGIFAYPDEETPNVYGVMKDVDFTGIQNIRLYAFAMKPIMGGGPLEVRIGSHDAEPIAEVEIEASFSPDPEEAIYDIDVASLQGEHDLYITTSPTDGSGQAAFAIVSMEFQR